MIQRFFSIGEFKAMTLRLLNASTLHDGIELQKLEAEIIDRYKETTMTHYQYTTLSNMCSILLEDWRVNYK